MQTEEKAYENIKVVGDRQKKQRGRKREVGNRTKVKVLDGGHVTYSMR